MVAADWCRQTTFEGTLKLPAVLSMDEEEKKELLQELRTWDGDHDETSPAELLSFTFQKKTDYEKFNKEIVDKRHLKVFSRFEEE